MILFHPPSSSLRNWRWVKFPLLSHESQTHSVQLELLQLLKGELFWVRGLKDFATVQLLVAYQRLSSSFETPNQPLQEVSGDSIRFHSLTSETQVLDVPSSLALQFPAIPLWPSSNTSLIMKSFETRDKDIPSLVSNIQRQRAQR